MDIHKPKPWHGAREFLKEYAIIVVGVLTALGAEQAVEAIHTAHKAAEAEDLVREEMARNLLFARDLALFAPCHRAEFEGAQRLLLASAPSGQLGTLPHFAFRTRTFTWGQWEGAVASGIAGHFPTERRLIYQRLYLLGDADGGGSLNALQQSRLELAGRLGTLRLPPRQIDIGTREQLLQDARLANFEEGRIEGLASAFATFAEPLRLPAPKVSTRTHPFTPAEVKACLDNVAAETAGLPPLPPLPPA